MIRGTVSDESVPVIELQIAGKQRAGVIDTGFNGDLELPESLRPSLNVEFLGYLESTLATGRTVIEANYSVELPFDGLELEVEATFCPGEEDLFGTRLLQDDRLEIVFPERTVVLERMRNHPE